MYAGKFRSMKWLLDILKGTWLGHPLHPILAHIPMAMWPGALIFDLLSRCQVGGNAIVRLIILRHCLWPRGRACGRADWIG